MDPEYILPQGLRDNFVSDFFTALLTLLFFDQALEAVERHRAQKKRTEDERAAMQMLDHDLHALWSLLVPVRPREDPVRRDTPQKRVELFLRDLREPETWNDAPAAHATAVRARIRDLGEDADARGFHALRAACRTLDEDWDRIPRGHLTQRFATAIAPGVEAALAKLRAPTEDE